MYIIKNTTIINNGITTHGDVYMRDQIIEKIGGTLTIPHRVEEIDGEGKILIPGVIDDQVHFREPGLTHKATIASESRAAVLGGVTSFMEMPNTNPPSYTQTLLEEKYELASRVSSANYSFYLGASNDNIEEVKRVDKKNVCGIKVFMGSSTGNLLVDSQEALSSIFEYAPILVATHCEEESIIRANKEIYRDKHDVHYHPIIRSREACIVSSSKAIELAKKFNTRLHILHISTGEEVQFFDNKTPLAQKRITSEACVHHLWFSDRDYDFYGSKIVCNPAIKEESDRLAIWQGLRNNYIDIIATDHAPHTLEEKNKIYPDCPSGVPLVQHTLLMMLEKVREGYLTLPELVTKMCNAPAICFQISNRGFIEEGYFADLALINPHKSTQVTKESLAYQCGWSPFENQSFSHSIDYTWVSGQLMQKNGEIIAPPQGKRLQFNRS